MIKSLMAAATLLILSYVLEPAATRAYYETRLLFKSDEINRCLHQFGSYFTVGHNVICRDIYR